MLIKINYEKIINEFNSDLVDKLRLHGSDKQYIKLWVPDEKFIRSFESLLEALSLEGYKKLELEVKKDFISDKDKDLLIKSFEKIEVNEIQNGYILKLNNIDSFFVKKKIIDKVKETQTKIVKYEYGSFKTPSEVTKLKHFFKSEYEKIKNKKDNFKKKNQIKNLKNHLVKIDNVKIYFYISSDNKFKKIFSDADDKYLIAAIYIFQKNFINKSPFYIGKNGISEYIEFLKTKKLINIKGIVLPFNLGYEIIFIHKLCQFLYKKFINDKDIFFIKKPETEWTKLNLVSKKRKCENEIQRFLLIERLEKNLIFLDDIHKDLYGYEIRVFINFKDSNYGINKPNQIRKLENFLKERIDITLQVFYKEKRDLSKIRRL